MAPNERVHFAFHTSSEGALHSSHEGSGAAGKETGTEPCAWDVWIDISGTEPLRLAVAAHYMDTTNTPELDYLAERMPPRFRGDWYWFGSALEVLDV